MIEKWMEQALEEESLDEILTNFDMEPLEAFMHLFNAGLIDEELLEELYATG